MSAAQFHEKARLIPLRDEQIVAVLAQPVAVPSSDLGLVIVVGGPQYRAGSHRQFVLLARTLAAAGFPVLRFDCRGMGDSTGAMRTFLEFDEDIRAAIDALLADCPQLRGVVLWGLCDGATAASFYAASDARVAGLILLNPWVRSEAGEARTMLKNYYWQRLTSPALWRKIFSGQFALRDSLRSLISLLTKALRPAAAAEPASAVAAQAPSCAREPLAQALPAALLKTAKPALVVLSGNDFVAAEFDAAMKASKPWQDFSASALLELKRFPAANHTFSCEVWRTEVEQASLDSMCRWQAQTLKR